jgi:hypothetical protein
MTSLSSLFTIWKHIRKAHFLKKAHFQERVPKNQAKFLLDFSESDGKSLQINRYKFQWLLYRFPKYI